MDIPNRQEQVERKGQFERLLRRDSSSKTVSEVLLGLKGKSRVSIENLTNRGERSVNINRSDILTVYKDGMALTTAEEYPNGHGYYHHYFLHRNNEDKVYHLDDFMVEKCYE